MNAISELISSHRLFIVTGQGGCAVQVDTPDIKQNKIIQHKKR